MSMLLFVLFADDFEIHSLNATKLAPSSIVKQSCVFEHDMAFCNHVRQGRWGPWGDKGYPPHSQKFSFDFPPIFTDKPLGKFELFIPPVRKLLGVHQEIWRVNLLICSFSRRIHHKSCRSIPGFAFQSLWPNIFSNLPSELRSPNGKSAFFCVCFPLCSILVCHIAMRRPFF